MTKFTIVLDDQKHDQLKEISIEISKKMDNDTSAPWHDSSSPILGDSFEVSRENGTSLVEGGTQAQRDYILQIISLF